MQMPFKKGSDTTPYVQAVVANFSGEIFELDGYAAVGMSAGVLTPLKAVDLIDMPYGSELMHLPQRRPIVYNLYSSQMETLLENPFEPGQAIYPVAVFNSPGYTVSHACAYEERSGADILPMFSYGATGWFQNEFWSAAIQVDAEPRQDLRRMPQNKVISGIQSMRRQLPHNRLRNHLETCATVYGCPAAKNFFIGRYEAPLPTARRCNARCLGCLSLQKNTGLNASQERIQFTPTAKEIAQVALAHINRTTAPIVSFGQGCEGDPLFAAREIEQAIVLIRNKTRKGTIHINTNAGRPDLLKPLIDAGLDSIRVSLNSVCPDIYNPYFRPQGYRLKDVFESIDLALNRGCFVAINYLNSPGINDSKEEVMALMKFIEQHPIHMIQWRNLNFDPLCYWRSLPKPTQPEKALGMGHLIESIKTDYPLVIHGYFNPPKEKWPPSFERIPA